MDAGLACQGVRVGMLLAETWRIERRIGTGGMAAVYAARHERNGGRVAVKVLHPDASCDPQTVRRFRREGYLANTVNHPGVVRIYDDGVTSDGSVFLIMDLLEGETLEEHRIAHGGRLPFDRAIAVSHAVLGILSAAHREGVVHRDVKPANVFLTSDGQVKLLDFGIATMAQSATAASKTSTGAGWGTVHFMAPEQITGDGARGSRVDVWAVGVMFYKLVSGQYPFTAKTLIELAAAYRTRPAMLDRVVPGFPAGIARVIDRALTCDPAERWADAGAMRRALDEAEDEALRTTAMNPAAEAGDAWSSMTLALATVPRLPLPPQAPQPSPARPLPAAPAEPRPSSPPGMLRAARAPGTSAPSTPRDHRRLVLGFLALSIATFVSSATYCASGRGEPSATASTSSSVVGSSK